MRNQELFNYMSREHGLTLLESEMHEIELIVARTLANDRVQEAARSSQGFVTRSEWVGDWDEARNREYARKLRAGEPTTEEEWGASYNWHLEQLRRQSGESPTEKAQRACGPEDVQ